MCPALYTPAQMHAYARAHLAEREREVEALRAEVEGWKAQVHDEISANLAFREAGGALPDEDMPTFCARLIADKQRAEAQAAADRQDAERYRWLRDNVFPHAYHGRQQPHVVMAVYLGHDDRGRLCVMHPGRESHVGIPSLDTAIDQARAMEQETKA